MKAVSGEGIELVVSVAKPVTLTPYNLPFVRPALSIIEPVFVFVPTYTNTWLPYPSLVKAKIVLSCALGLATAFSKAILPNIGNS